MGCDSSNTINTTSQEGKRKPPMEQKPEQKNQVHTNITKEKPPEQMAQEKDDTKQEKNGAENKNNEKQKKKDQETEKQRKEILPNKEPNNTATQQQSNIKKSNDKEEKVPNNSINKKEETTTKEKNKNEKDEHNADDKHNDNTNNDDKPIQKSNSPSAAMGKFNELLTTEYSGRCLETKSKVHLRFDKKKPKIEMNCRAYNGENAENKDIKFLILKRKDYIDIYYIFNHKGKYRTYLYAMDTEAGGSFECVAYYEFQCEEEWVDGDFDFKVELRELYDQSFEERCEDFKIKESSLKNIIFKAKNREKINFKFKPDSDIIITDISLLDVVDELPGNVVERVVKYYIKDKNLDIDIIFNKKGKYKIQIIYFDNSQFDGTEASAKKCLKYMFYYAVVESDAKEHKEFSDEEILITRPFEDSLKMGKFKSISHKNQNVSAKDVETFEFEFNSDKWDEHGINSYIYPEETDSIYENFCRIDNKIIFYFSIDADIKYLITFDIVIWGHNLGTIVYIVSASDYFKNTPIIRKNIIETIDRKKIENLVKASKKREDMEYKEFLSYFRELTKNLTNSEKAYALYYWIAKNISYDFEGYSSGDSDINPESVYKNGYGVCSGYSRLLSVVGGNIGIFVLNCIGYARASDYKLGDEFKDTNHEWNIIKLDGVYYQIDSTWGAMSLIESSAKSYFCPEPEQFFFEHFPKNSKWQLITPNLSMKEFINRVIPKGNLYELFTKTDFVYYNIQVKNKTVLRFYKKVEKVEFLNSFYDENKKRTDDVKCLVKQKKDYVDLIFIFKHKGKYSTQIAAKDEKSEIIAVFLEYYFNSEEEWGDKAFDFSMDEYDLMDKFLLESMSHKELEFKANNKEKLSFKFKPDSKISIERVSLKSEDDNKYLNNVTKLSKKDKDVDIEVIFNKKGKYQLIISYNDMSISEGKRRLESITYHPYVESDAKEYEEFPEEE